MNNSHELEAPETAPDPGRHRDAERITHADDVRTRNIQIGVVITGLIVLCAFFVRTTGPLSAPKAVVLGAVEGITEFLPVSSTGHLLVTQRLLGLGEGSGKTAADTYAVSIQIGAILAVVALYRHRLVQLMHGLLGRDADGRDLLVRLSIAFVPAAAVGLVLGDVIKAQLFGLWPVIAAWFVGGVFLLWWRPRAGTIGITGFTARHAAIIGVAQILALWPGVSRSLTTIVAALALGATMSAAVEFSFLLGLATLSAATLYDLTKSGSTLVADYGVVTPILGTIVAFLTALVAVRWLVTTLSTRPLSIFGWYRIGAALLTATLVGLSVI
jgi:undecaprenyl-diphosphatase